METWECNMGGEKVLEYTTKMFNKIVQGENILQELNMPYINTIYKREVGNHALFCNILSFIYCIISTIHFPIMLFYPDQNTISPQQD